jgi:drug/metabolite transporter (DMT)-like permease
MFLALIAALSGGCGDIANKILLARFKLALRQYLPLIFMILTVISYFLIPINYKFVQEEALRWSNIAIFLVMVTAATVWNTLLAKSLQSEPLHEYETIILTVPLFTVILAAIFFPAERNLHVLRAGIVASLVLLLFKMKKHHLSLSGNARRTALAVVFIAVEVVCLRHLLNFYSPSLLYFIRVALLALIFAFIYRPSFRLELRQWIGLVAAAIFGTGVMVLKYYAFVQIGVVFTTMVLLLSPFIAYGASYYYLKERKDFRRDFICALIIVACIIYSAIMRLK